MNKISVVILNFNRPEFIKKNILKKLNKITEIDEILISHGKKETFFEGKVKGDTEVINFKHWENENKEYGLSLRFYTSLQAKNNKIIIMDDDIIPSQETVSFLNEKIEEEKERIYGIYGRNLDKNNNYQVTNFFGEVPIVLTRFLITTKEMCQYFMDNFRIYENDMVKNSKPYWNGEDILFSLLSIKKYNNLPKSYSLSHDNSILNYLNFKDSISIGNVDHLKYRQELTKYFLDSLKLENKIKKSIKIKTWRSQFTYFFTNSILVSIFYIFVIFTFIFDIYYYIVRF